MSETESERTEVITVGDVESSRAIRPNGANEYFGVRTFESFIVAVLLRAKVDAYREHPASRGVMAKADLFDLAKRHLGHAFGRLDRQKIKGPKGGVVRWKRTMAWAKVTLQREENDPRIVQRGKWVVLCDPSVTKQAWIDWALQRPKRRKPQARSRGGPYALRKKARARNVRARAAE